MLIISPVLGAHHIPSTPCSPNPVCYICDCSATAATHPSKVAVVDKALQLLVRLLRCSILTLAVALFSHNRCSVLTIAVAPFSHSMDSVLTLGATHSLPQHADLGPYSSILRTPCSPHPSTAPISLYASTAPAPLPPSWCHALPWPVSMLRLAVAYPLSSSPMLSLATSLRDHLLPAPSTLTNAIPDSDRNSNPNPKPNPHTPPGGA